MSLTRTNTPALRALQRVGNVVAAAHSQDFQRRKRPEVVGDSPADETMLKNDADGASSDDDDDHYHEEIDGSVVGDNDNEGGADTGRRLEQSSSNLDGLVAGALGSSSDIGGEADITEVRNLAEEYHPEVGFRGKRS